jgi:hypothetical protein
MRWRTGSGWLIEKCERKGKIYWKVCPYYCSSHSKIRTDESTMQNLKLFTSEQLGIADDTVA